MAHELDMNAVTGKRAMFSVIETPWHREGFVVDTPPSMDEAMKLAGCDFDVVCRPVFVPGDPTAEAMRVEDFHKSPTGQAVVRLDRQGPASILAMVGDHYQPLQYRDAFGVLEPLLDKGVATLETGGTLRGGRDAWMLARFDVKDPVVQEVFAGELIPFGLVTSNHSGDASVILMETPVRVVCANTLGMALARQGNAVKVAHRGENAKVRVVEAAEQLFAGLVDRYRTIAKQYEAMKARILTVEEFTASVLDRVAPLPPDLHTPAGEHLTIRGYDLARKAAEERRAALTSKWHTGKGHTGDSSAWEAYNGAVEVIDHDVALFRTRGSRVASLLGGRLAECKATVLNRLAVLSGATAESRN